MSQHEDINTKSSSLIIIITIELIIENNKNDNTGHDLQPIPFNDMKQETDNHLQDLKQGANNILVYKFFMY